MASTVTDTEKGLAMGLILAGAALVTYYAADRFAALLKRRRLDRNRADADYPITANDPTGRIII